MRRLTIFFVAVLSFTGLWLAAGPSALGGPATYVSTYGISMQPSFKAGDLAILKPAATYTVGDVAGYEADTLNKTLVMHRIVETEGDRFVFQGDNNSWLDPDKPTEDQIVGKLWFQIPGGGIWLTRLTSPPVIAAMAFLILLTLSGAEAYARRGRRRRRSMAGSNPGGDFGAWWSIPPKLQPVMTTALVLAGLGVVLAALAFTRPVTTTTTKDSEATQEVEFSYSATVPPTPAYETTQVVSPDPVFRKVTNTVTVAYDYTGPEPGGTARFDARLSTSGGWVWTLPLTSETAFDADTHRATATLNLNEIEARAKAGSEAAGLSSGGDVTITLAPTITTDSGEWQPTAPLSLTTTSLTVSDAEALKVTNPVTSQQTVTTPATMKLLVLTVPVSTARAAAVGLMLLGGLGIAAVLLLAARSGPPPERDVIARRYKQQLVPVADLPTSATTMIDVPDIDSLAKIAKRYALMILHVRTGASDIYFVQDESTTYRYISREIDPYRVAAAAAGVGPAHAAGKPGRAGARGRGPGAAPGMPTVPPPPGPPPSFPPPAAGPPVGAPVAVPVGVPVGAAEAETAPLGAAEARVAEPATDERSSDAAAVTNAPAASEAESSPAPSSATTPDDDAETLAGAEPSPPDADGEDDNPAAS